MTPRTKADFAERDRLGAERIAFIRANAPARCIDGTVDMYGECIRCGTSAAEICRNETP